jgi:hypothetical protein
MVFSGVDGDTTLSTQSATLTLMITVSANATELHHAEEAINAINTINTWKSAVNIIKRVMDTVSPIAGVCSISFLLILRRANFRTAAEPLCKSSMEAPLKDSRGASPFLLKHAEHLLFICCQTLLQQVQRDENVEALLETIRDAFEFAEEADTLRSIKPESKQAKILEQMLECVSESAKFIKSYAEDVQVGTLSSALSFVILYKHMIFRKADPKEYHRQS